MFNGNYKSIREIIYRAKRHPLMADALFSDMATVVYDTIKLLGVPIAYDDSIEYIPIVENRGKLPKDLLYIDGAEWMHGTSCLPMRYAISSSGGRWNCVSKKGCSIVSTLTYTIKRGYIYTDKENGTVKLLYKRIVMDDENYPMIPDNVSVIKAIVAAVQLDHFNVLHDMGEIPAYPVQKLQQEYAWYMSQAEGSLKMPSVDEMETIKNALVRMIPNFNAHDEQFNYESLTRVN